MGTPAGEGIGENVGGGGGGRGGDGENCKCEGGQKEDKARRDEAATTAPAPAAEARSGMDRAAHVDRVRARLMELKRIKTVAADHTSAPAPIFRPNLLSLVPSDPQFAGSQRLKDGVHITLWPRNELPAHTTTPTTIPERLQVEQSHTRMSSGWGKDRRGTCAHPPRRSHLERIVPRDSDPPCESGAFRSETGAATVDEVVKREGMSTTTFYAHFDGKEDALMAAIDRAAAQIVAAIIPVFRRADKWSLGVRAGFGTLFNFLASRPALARLLADEIYAAGPMGVERRAKAMAPLQELIAEGFERSPQTPRIATEFVDGAVYTLAYRTVQDKGPEDLPHFTPLCTYIALTPFVGTEKACEVANGTGRERRQ